MASVNNFNPRSLAGATSGRWGQTDPWSHFNPRSLAGATAVSIVTASTIRNFNPRSLAGATELPEEVDQLWAISIHAPSRERLYGTIMLL